MRLATSFVAVAMAAATIHALPIPAVSDADALQERGVVGYVLKHDRQPDTVTLTRRGKFDLGWFSDIKMPKLSDLRPGRVINKLKYGRLAKHRSFKWRKPWQVLRRKTLISRDGTLGFPNRHQLLIIHQKQYFDPIREKVKAEEVARLEAKKKQDEGDAAINAKLAESDDTIGREPALKKLQTQFFSAKHEFESIKDADHK